MNLNTIKKEVRIALENSNCSSKYTALVDSRKKSMIDSVARRIKEQGITVAQATAFANDITSFQQDLDSRREDDFLHMALREKKLKTKYKKHRKVIHGMNSSQKLVV